MFSAGNTKVKFYMALISWKVQLDFMAEFISSPFQNSLLKENHVSLWRQVVGTSSAQGTIRYKMVTHIHICAQRIQWQKFYSHPF